MRTSLVIVIALLVACDKTAKPVPLSRTALKIENKDRVPRHGVYAAFSGLAGFGPAFYWVAVDTDADLVTQPATEAYDPAARKSTRPLKASEKAALHAAIDDARHTNLPEVKRSCTDIWDVIVIADDDKVILAESGCPLADSSFAGLRKLVWSMTSWPDGSQP